MRELTSEQVEYAVGRLARLIEQRGWKQKELEAASGVDQSTISKILSHTIDPSSDNLAKLFQGLGLKLTDILNESECLPDKILGYLATPLTGLHPEAQRELKRLVQQVRSIASDPRFAQPPFEIYWPGDHTHPEEHPNLRAEQVYVLDRSRTSTQDFVVLLCAERSYGVGQENEIATQAGVPAIRLIPDKGMSRMMLGSFICAIDVPYTGNLATGIHINQEDLTQAFQEVRRLHFRHRALYRGLGIVGFGDRLKRLIDDRCGSDYRQLADELGIRHTYLLSLINEPFSVSNPSGRLLVRIAARLGERVAFLLGESEEQDPVWVESNESWGKWMEEGEDIDGTIAYRLRKKWRTEYLLARREQLSTASFRNSAKLMKVEDWEREYRKVSKGRSGPGSGQRSLV